MTQKDKDTLFFADFSKVFVAHRVLLNKLKIIVFVLPFWLSDCLHDRSQSYKLSQSAIIKKLNILKLCLLHLFIIDIYDACSSSSSLYADDANIYIGQLEQ